MTAGSILTEIEACRDMLEECRDTLLEILISDDKDIKARAQLKPLEDRIFKTNDMLTRIYAERFMEAR